MISDFGRIEKSVNGQNYFEIQENNFACEFTTHHTCRRAEMNLKSTTTNRFKFWLTNSLWNLGEGGGGGYVWPGLTINGTGACFKHDDLWIVL